MTEHPDIEAAIREVLEAEWAEDISISNAKLLAQWVINAQGVIALVPDLVDWMERYRGGDEKLHPEEFYIRRDSARAALARLASLSSPPQPPEVTL